MDSRSIPFEFGAALYSRIESLLQSGKTAGAIQADLLASLSQQDIGTSHDENGSIAMQLFLMLKGCHFFWNKRVALVHACWLNAWLQTPGCDGYFDHTNGQRQHWLDAMVSHGQDVNEYASILESLEPSILLAHQHKIIEIMQKPDLSYAFFIEKYLHLKFEQSQNFDGIWDYLRLQCSQRSVFSAFKAMVSRYPGPAIRAYVEQGGDLMLFSDAMLAQSGQLKVASVVWGLGISNAGAVGNRLVHTGQEQAAVLASLPGLACLHGRYDLLKAMNDVGDLNPDAVHIKGSNRGATLRQLNDAFALHNPGHVPPLVSLRANENILLAEDILGEFRESRAI